MCVFVYVCVRVYACVCACVCCVCMCVVCFVRVWGLSAASRVLELACDVPCVRSSGGASRLVPAVEGDGRVVGTAAGRDGARVLLARDSNRREGAAGGGRPVEAPVLVVTGSAEGTR